jgi:hypothetical protein
MWKWLRSWFAWRFSLGRLVVATVFLGAFLGLNMRKIGPYGGFGLPDKIHVVAYWGWPLPFIRSRQNWYRPPITNPATADKIQQEWDAWVEKNLANEIPLSHQTYYAFEWWPLSQWPFNDVTTESGVVLGRIIDAVFALTVLFLILFLQIPRRKAPEQVK